MNQIQKESALLTRPVRTIASGVLVGGLGLFAVVAVFLVLRGMMAAAGG